MKHRRRKTALLSAAAAAVLVLQGSFAALAASPQFAYDADTWAKLQDNVMEYSELPYLVQEYNPTYLNNQTTYQAGRDTKNAKEVQDKQYNQARITCGIRQTRLRIIWQCRAWQVRMPA